MNDLRMYVEHLFEGKTMTAELIELKEEIYGNLVARYEDCIKEGLDEAEALRRTKASMTSIDDLVDDDGHAQRDVVASPVSPTVPSTEAAAPVERTEKPRSKRNIIIAAVVLLFVCIGLPLAALLAFDEVADSDAHETVQAVKEGVRDKSGDDAVTIGPDGSVRLDGEPADDVLNSVVSSDALQAWSGTSLSDTDKLQELVRALPLGDWNTALDAAGGNGGVALGYEVPHQYDDDSVDVAMVYVVTSLFAHVSDAQQVSVSITESDDTRDADRYVFTRQALEGQYGFALNGDALDDDAWDALKTDHLYRGGFVERAKEAAERD